jgi:hypothetical protein
VLKVDFEKAYDSNGWGLFDYRLRMSEFSDKWREDLACVENVGSCEWKSNERNQYSKGV